jgi:hypothetical protein
MGAPTTRAQSGGRSPETAPDEERDEGLDERQGQERGEAPSEAPDEAPDEAGSAAVGRGSGEGPGDGPGQKCGEAEVGAPFLTRRHRPGALERLRTPRRPRIWFEIVLILASYWVYSLIRNAVPEQRAQALSHADWVWHTEHRLGIAVEHSVNHTANGVTWLIVTMDYYYATLHFIVTIGVLIWLYRAHPGRYAAVRLVLFATTGIALLGYYLFPLAPPRLMRGGQFIDTVHLHHTWGSTASGNLANMSNQYAAMPSMHIGWSVWCGLTIATLAKPLWSRMIGAVYPALTLTVIVCTANHFWLDAVGGLICLSFGFGLSHAFYGRGPYRLPRVVGVTAPAAVAT